MTAIQTEVRHALIAIAESDSTLRNLCGDRSGFVVNWRDLATAKLPVIALKLISHPNVTGTGDRREIQWQFTAVAEGNGALDAVEAITERLRSRTLFTTSAIADHGVDAAVIARTARSDEPDGPLLANRVSESVDLTLLVHAAPLVAIS